MPTVINMNGSAEGFPKNATVLELMLLLAEVLG